MGRKIDPRIAQRLSTLNQPLVEEPVEPAPSQFTTPAPVAEQNVYEMNADSGRIRAWGRGWLIVYCVSAALLLLGGIIAYQTFENKQPSLYFLGGFLSSLLLGFWAKQMHSAFADLMDMTGDIQRRLRRQR